MTNDSLDLYIRMVDPELSPRQIDNFITMLRHEIKQEWGSSVRDPISSDSKNLDPVILGALTLTIIPTILTKFLEFLHAWSMRRENRHLKIKLQLPNKASLEIEIPQTSSPEELKKWIDLTRQSLLNSGRSASNKR